jgi:hypothetical protein
MTALLEQYFNSDKLKQIAFDKNYDDISVQEFLRFIEYHLNQEIKYGVDEDYEGRILRYADEYLSLFVWERKKGLSVDWAKEFAQQMLDENENHAAAYAYVASKEKNPLQAKTDLELYAQLTNRDEYFVKHFQFLIDLDCTIANPSVEEQSIVYSNIYKAQIKVGKTELFADYYADLIAGEEYTEFGCLVEALEYEKAINEGHTRSDATYIATKLSECICNHCYTLEQSEHNQCVFEKRQELEKEFKSQLEKRKNTK